MINPMYCVITTRDNDHLDEAFTTEIKSFLTPDDYYQIAGYDTLTESIYFMYIDEWKVIRMIEFFIKNGVLLEYQVVKNILDFINSDEKYKEVYSDEHNKMVMDNFIFNTLSVDAVLDRINENRNNKEFLLSEIEKTVLGVCK